MGALIQKSVKVTPEMDVWITETAKQISCSENRFMVESLQSTIDMINHPSGAHIPRIVWLALSAKAHSAGPPPPPRKGVEGVGRMSWW